MERKNNRKKEQIYPGKKGGKDGGREGEEEITKGRQQEGE